MEDKQGVAGVEAERAKVEESGAGVGEGREGQRGGFAMEVPKSLAEL